MSFAHLRKPVTPASFVRRWHLVAAGIVALAALIGVLVGYQVGSHGPQYNAQYFLRFPLIEPHPMGPTLGLGVPAPRADPVSQSQIFIAASQMPPVSDQGGVGQCQCSAFDEQLEHLLLKRTRQSVSYSCRFWYSLINDGKDIGSRIEDYVQMLSSIGGLRTGEGFDYAGSPKPAELNATLARSFIPAAARHRYPIVEHEISSFYGGGENALNGCDQELLHNRTCNFGFPVYYSGDPMCEGPEDVNSNAGYIDLPADWSETKSPHTACSIIGYHAVTLRGMTKTRCMPERGGTCGFYLAQNHWTRHWGVNCVTGEPDQQNGGCGWISRRMVARVGFSLVSLRLLKTVTPQTSIPVHPFLQPGPYRDHQLPPPKDLNRLRVPRLGAGPLWVAAVCAKDVRGPDPLHACHGALDMAPYINREARRVGISPVGFTATLGAECGLFTHSTQCDRLGGGYDYSFGACQVTIATAAEFGLGSGYFDGYYGANTSRIRDYENVAAQCIHLGSTVMGNYARIERSNCPPAADYPNLDVAWNAGPYQPCSFLMSPTGQAGSNFYLNFQGWMRWAYSFARSGADPYALPPKPFRQRVWCHWYRTHHRACARPKRHGRRTWAASIFYAHPRLGGKRPRDAWVPPNRRAHRRHGFNVYRFEHGVAYAAPSTGHVRIVYR